MKKILQLGAIALATALTGCAATGPKFTEQQATTPKLAADQGRVYFYRVNSFVGAAVRPDIKLDGAAVGESTPGGYFYVDTAAGSHEAQTSTEVSNKLTFVLDKGETKYVRTSVSMGLMAGHVKPELVGQEEALKELPELSYTGKAAAK
ncbi:DUF2846 domain-containing protein [Pseudoduganella buxea]|uniref:DUF2846 domain-containing protein n=1 Tax=Pseudoduganella buxea TaxID=1949069 RepID=A0A6I3SWA1_9BURK|nr:DUF2846 domain-containing protein [Pseudoduganella buxea]MTV52017.1 DUF2846 domain-containing protein [Pseudoduganella buxea]GGB98001.1 hypothetical protein GCM10011572_19900 [Pseudoduganella buxea]